VWRHSACGRTVLARARVDAAVEAAEAALAAAATAATAEAEQAATARHAGALAEAESATAAELCETFGAGEWAAESAGMVRFLQAELPTMRGVLCQLARGRPRPPKTAPCALLWGARTLTECWPGGFPFAVSAETLAQANHATTADLFSAIRGWGSRGLGTSEGVLVIGRDINMFGAGCFAAACIGEAGGGLGEACGQPCAEGRASDELISARRAAMHRRARAAA
jgi:hypothetical protein